mmetsp:Transcript_30526/g.34274  ORF Transcript_30526/g.34274 Transcript_30526/m.34274 type:complete len:237 (-) Transcript_30526:1511-2221(-)
MNLIETELQQRHRHNSREQGKNGGGASHEMRSARNNNRYLLLFLFYILLEFFFVFLLFFWNFRAAAGITSTAPRFVPVFNEVCSCCTIHAIRFRFVDQPIVDARTAVGSVHTASFHALFHRGTGVGICLVVGSTGAGSTGIGIGVHHLEIPTHNVIIAHGAVACGEVDCRERSEFHVGEGATLRVCNGVILPDVSTVFVLGESSGVDIAFLVFVAAKAQELQFRVDVDHAIIGTRH